MEPVKGLLIAELLTGQLELRDEAGRRMGYGDQDRKQAEEAWVRETLRMVGVDPNTPPEEWPDYVPLVPSD